MRSQIDVYIHLLQHDGSTLAACINATTIAIIDAGIPIYDYVCATTAGCINGTPVLDLNYIEESSFDSPNLTVAVLPRTEKIALLQMESKMKVDKLSEVLLLAKVGSKFIHTKLDETVIESTENLISKFVL